PEHIRSTCSERHANTNLVCALCDCVRKHAEQSDRSELLGQERKQRQQLREQTFHAKRFVSLFSLCDHVLYRQVRVDVAHYTTHARHCRGWIAGSTHFKNCVSQW